MEININDYLNENELKDIAQEEFRNAARRHFSNEKDISRIISNIGYKVIFDEIDSIIGDDTKKLIAKEVPKSIVNRDLSFYIFRDASIYEKASLGHEYLEQAVKDNQHIITEQVRRVLENVGEDRQYQIIRDVTDGIAETFADMLFAKGCDTE